MARRRQHGGLVGGTFCLSQRLIEGAPFTRLWTRPRLHCLLCRPVQWTPSSTIVTAHPHMPVLLAMNLSSPTQFVIPSPFPQKEAIPRYGSASIILTHPTEEFLFAFFPGRQASHGAGVIYQRKQGVNEWQPFNSTLQLPFGAGIVGGRWLPNMREVRMEV